MISEFNLRKVVNPSLLSEHLPSSDYFYINLRSLCPMKNKELQKMPSKADHI